jgi:hypothetical protein
MEKTLAEKLIKARRLRRLSIWQATQKMDGVFPYTLRTLEGQNPERNPRGDRCELKTVLELIRVYWPEITLDDFTDRELLIRVVPKDAKSHRRLNGYVAKTG